MVVVVMMAVVMAMMVVMVVMMLGHRGGCGGRSGFLRHGVAGEAQRENGGG
jgi:hypothetical protein